MNKHTFWMIIGCGLPLLIIFFAPALGLGYGTSLFVFIILMFGCHLLMPMNKHSNHNLDLEKQNSQPVKTENHANTH